MKIISMNAVYNQVRNELKNKTDKHVFAESTGTHKLHRMTNKSSLVTITTQCMHMCNVYYTCFMTHIDNYIMPMKTLHISCNTIVNITNFYDCVRTHWRSSSRNASWSSVEDFKRIIQCLHYWIAFPMWPSKCKGINEKMCKT